MSEKSEDALAEEGGAKKSGKKKLIILVLLILLLGGGGAGAFLILGKSKEKAEGKEEHVEEHKPNLVYAQIEPAFIVNLADSGSYLKVAVWLEYDIDRAKKLQEGAHGAGGHGSGGSGGGDKAPVLEGILKTKEPLIKDAIIRVLSSKTVDEARSTTLRDAIKGELVEAINEVVTEEEGPVTDVLFTEYIVQ